MEYKFDNDFRFKNLPDETTPHTAENMNKALENTSWLKSQLDGTIKPMSGSSIEIKDNAETMLNKLEIEGKSVQDGEPSPDNPVEIKSVGKLNDEGKYEFDLNISTKNLLDYSIEQYEFSKKNSRSGFVKLNQPLKLKSGTYTFSISDLVMQNNNYNLGITFNKISGEEVGTAGVNTNKKYFNLTLNNDETLTKLYVYINLSDNDNATATFSKIQFEVGTEATAWEPHKGNLTTFTLNEPLRSLSNGTKDLLYIKNGHLYVTRKIKKYVFTGEETTITIDSQGRFFIDIKDLYNPLKRRQKVVISNKLTSELSTTAYSSWDTYKLNSIAVRYIDDASCSLGIKTNVANTVDNFKTWLKEQFDTETPLEIDYQLATPTTEDLGEIEMPSTYKDKSTITTTDELEPNINLEYVKDTILTNYVEKRLINLIK